MSIGQESHTTFFNLDQRTKSIPNSLKREFKVPIRFMKPFPAAPAVVIAPIKLDWLEGLPVGFDIYVSQVSKAGFELTYVALTPNQINGFDIHWGAIYDPKIAVITKSYSGDAMKTLAENTRTNNNLDFTIKYFVPLFRL